MKKLLLLLLGAPFIANAMYYNLAIANINTNYPVHLELTDTKCLHGDIKSVDIAPSKSTNIIFTDKSCPFYDDDLPTILRYRETMDRSSGQLVSNMEIRIDKPHGKDAPYFIKVSSWSLEPTDGNEFINVSASCSADLSNQGECFTHKYQTKINPNRIDASISIK